MVVLIREFGAHPATGAAAPRDVWVALVSGGLVCCVLCLHSSRIKMHISTPLEESQETSGSWRAGDRRVSSTTLPSTGVRLSLKLLRVAVA
jgi:hypothetical protein